jgi:AraC-like DNA-binding protein
VLASQAQETTLPNQAGLAACTFDLLATAISSVRPDGALQSRSRSLSLYRVKEFIEQHLADPTLNTDAISLGVGLSPRYINKLFDDEGASSSLLRYVWARRLEHCRRDLSDVAHLGHRVSDIALRWGFNDLSHFSRAFKARFNVSPRQFRDQAIRDIREIC